MNPSDYSVACMSGVRRMQSELSAAFDLVADKANWKMPVDALVASDADVALIADAVVHFTGSVATVTANAFGLRVEAAGYYRAVGA